YYRWIALAQQARAAGDAARAEELLDECPARRRGWEWRYLKAARDRGPLRLRGHTREVRAVAFSPEGRRLASRGHDHPVPARGTPTGQQLLALHGHAGYVSAVAFSPDGRRLASAGWDGAVKVWDAYSGREVFPLARHAGPAHGVAFSR